MLRALLLSGHAGWPHTQLGDTGDRPLEAGDVRVRMEAAALNPLDAKIASGAMRDWFPVVFPYVPGTDFAGVVEAVGATVTNLSVGDPVFGRADPVRGGAVADSITVAAELVARRPDALRARDAACLPTPAGVAVQVLEMLSRAESEPLLILGEGMVARMAAALAGGAARQVTTYEELLAAGEVRHAIDTIGGALGHAALRMLPPGSHLVTLTAPADAGTAAARGVRADFVVLQTSRRQLEAVRRAAEDGVLRPTANHVIALEDAPAAFDRYVARDLGGKIAIERARR